MIFKGLGLPEEWEWMRERTHIIMCEDSEGLVVYDETGKILACCVADSFTVDGCCVHFAIDNPLVIRRGFFEAIARHLYIDRGRRRLWGMVPDNNDKAFKLDKKIGFTEVARIPNAIQEGIGYIIMELRREDCRWLPEELREAA